jgi:peptide deformylase
MSPAEETPEPLATRAGADEPDAPGDAELEVEVEDGAAAPAELDPEVRERRDRALAYVRKLGDPALRARAVPVERFDERLAAEVARMGELMIDALGVGLAATQVGVLHRVLVYRVGAEDPVTVLVNPELEWVSDELEAAIEGCLSIPDVHVEVERPARVRVRARDEHGAEVEIEAQELAARVIQHEIDHLDGILILDRISRQARKEAMREMREAREPREESDAPETHEAREPPEESDAREVPETAGAG